jgi:RND superfamily putative drug exporter
LDRVTDLIFRYSKFVLVGWVLLVVVGAVFALGLEGRTVPGGEASPSSQAESVARELSDNGVPSLFIVVTGKAATPDGDGQRALKSIVDKVAGTPGVRQVAPLPLPPAAPDAGPVTVLGVSATGGVDSSIDVAHTLLDIDGLAPAGSEVFLGGYGAHREELVELSRSDLLRAEQVGLPIVLAVLLLTFGALWASAVPLVIAGSALIGGLGAAGALSFFLPLSEYVTNTASMIGLALAVDYAMFLVQRVREKLMEGSGVDDAIREAMRTTGAAILWSGLTVILAEATMFLVDSRAVRTAALGLVLVTCSVMVAALVCTPVMLRLLGYRILKQADRVRLRWTQSVTAPGSPGTVYVGDAYRDAARGGAIYVGPDADGEPAGFWKRWGRLMTRRAPVALAAGTLLLLALAAPALKLGENVNLPPAGAMPADSQVRKATEIGAAAYGPGVLSPVQIIVYGTPQTVRTDASLVAQTLRAEPEVRAAEVAPLERTDAYRVIVTTVHAPPDDRTHALVESLRDGRLRDVLARVEFDVGGETALRIDATDALFASLPVALVVLLFVVLVLLMIAMRSIVLPVKAVLLVVVSLAASMGGLLLLSTTKLGARLIGWSDPAELHPIVPITIVVIVIALATDYEVILISRIAERYAATGDNTRAIVNGVSHTGRVISSAAAIMIAVFFGFALSEVTPLKQIGVGLALAVLIDATLIRGVLVPASMQIMGRWNWWFPFLVGGASRPAVATPAAEAPAQPGAAPAQPIGLDSTRIEPTNGQPTNGQPTNGQPTNGHKNVLAERYWSSATAIRNLDLGDADDGREADDPSRGAIVRH